MEKPRERILAEKIAEDLFRMGGSNEKADHLRLYKDEKYLGGWAKKPAIDRIELIIREHKSTSK